VLKANTSESKPVMAHYAVRREPHFCPECKGPVIVKRGSIVSPHFAHAALTGCTYGEGESERHRQMKLQVLALFGEDKCEVEVPLIPAHRADVVYGSKKLLVIECQASSIDVRDWKERTDDYNNRGIYVLWVWDLFRLAHCRTWDELSTDEARIPAEIRHCQEASWGFLYAMDVNGELRSCHLDPPLERNTDEGPTWEARSYTPKTLRFIRTKVTPLSPCGLFGTGNLLIAQLGENTWWEWE